MFRGSYRLLQQGDGVREPGQALRPAGASSEADPRTLGQVGCDNADIEAGYQNKDWGASTQKFGDDPVGRLIPWHENEQLKGK
jgi:hypothetical protein